MSDREHATAAGAGHAELWAEVTAWLDEQLGPRAHGRRVVEGRGRRPAGPRRTSRPSRAGRGLAAAPGDGASCVRGLRRALPARRPRPAAWRRRRSSRTGTPDQIDRLVPPDPRRPGRRGASCSASPAPAPTSPGSTTRRRRATATGGSSAARRCGLERRMDVRLRRCCSPAPTSTSPSTRASRGSRSRLDQPGVDDPAAAGDDRRRGVQRGVHRRRRVSTTPTSSAARGTGWAVTPDHPPLPARPASALGGAHAGFPVPGPQGAWMPRAAGVATPPRRRAPNRLHDGVRRRGRAGTAHGPTPRATRRSARTSRLCAFTEDWAAGGAADGLSGRRGPVGGRRAPAAQPDPDREARRGARHPDPRTARNLAGADGPTGRCTPRRWCSRPGHSIYGSTGRSAEHHQRRPRRKKAECGPRPPLSAKVLRATERGAGDCLPLQLEKVVSVLCVGSRDHRPPDRHRQSRAG